MKLKLTFSGPNTVAATTKAEPIPIGHAVSFTTEVLSETTSLKDAARFWEMERTFNELTKGRLHVELFEEK